MFFLLRFDGHLTIRIPGASKQKGLLQALERGLSYDHKELVPEMRVSRSDPNKMYPTGRRNTRKFRKALYTRSDDEDTAVYITYQGFYKKIAAFLRGYGEVKVIDRREPFPEPRLDLTGGFRFSQETLFKEFLSHNQSGMFEAVTRWGKSRILLNWIKAFPDIPILYIAPGVDLIKQTYEFLCESFNQPTKGRVKDERRFVGKVFAANHKIGKRVTLASMDSLSNITDTEADQFRLVIIDESHASVSPERAPQLARFKRARFFAATATPTGRYDNADVLLEGLIGPVLTQRTYRQAVASKEIAPIRVYMLKMPLKFIQAVPNRNKAYKVYHYFNPLFRRTIELLFTVIPKEWQTLAFVDTEDQADYLLQKMPEFSVAMAKRFKNKTEREDMQNRMASGDVLRCFATSIYSQGVTFSDLRVMVNLSAGGGGITSIQRPGRLAEIVEGKKRGYLVDFEFFMATPKAAWASVPSRSQEWWCLVRDSEQRRKIYERIGYEIIEVSRIRDMVFE